MTHFSRCVAAATIPFFWCLGAFPSASGVEAQNASLSARQIVEEFYDRVTFDAGTTPDWCKVRALFADEAIVVLRTGRDTMTTFTLDGFVDDFVNFIEQSDVESAGFTERILKVKSVTYGDIAHVLVLFDSHINGSERTPRQGIDSFQLIREAGRWKIISITNDRPSPGNPIPMALFD